MGNFLTPKRKGGFVIPSSPVPSSRRQETFCAALSEVIDASRAERSLNTLLPVGRWIWCHWGRKISGAASINSDPALPAFHRDHPSPTHR